MCHEAWPDDLRQYATDIADWKMTAVETEMQHAPEVYTEYAAAKEEISIQERELICKYHCHPMDVDQLESACNASAAALAIEMYKRGILDGGRIYHGFVTGELPRKEGHE